MHPPVTAKLLYHQIKVNLGPLSSHKGTSVSAGSGSLATKRTQGVAMGAFSSEERHAISLGDNGFKSEATNTVKLGETEISTGENIQCCTDEHCCSYGITCCGSECGVSSDCCFEAIKLGVGMIADGITSVFNSFCQDE